MGQSVIVDEKGRVLLPKNARLKAGIGPKSKLVIEVKGRGIIELLDYDELSRKVQDVAMKKLTGWKEIEHREDKLLSRLSKRKILK